ncbi:hypothetical protein [Desulfuromonas sp.]|nr:hypothetical protein [Desulfuromonas sp.]
MDSPHLFAFIGATVLLTFAAGPGILFAITQGTGIQVTPPGSEETWR